MRTVCRQIRPCLRRGGRFLFDYSNWTARARELLKPRIDSCEDGDALVLRRSAWDVRAGAWQWEWYRLDPAEATVLTSRFVTGGLAASDVAGAVRSSGFEVELLAKWDHDGRPPGGSLRSFNENTDRGFVVVASPV